MTQQKCCTPEGQIKRYVDCIGCDRRPDNRITMAQQTEFIPYEQELELKDLGYISEPIVDSWRSLTLYQQAFRWFREKHKLLSVIDVAIDGKWFLSIYNLNAKRNDEIECEALYYDTYEEAELACLNKLIEIVKNK